MIVTIIPKGGLGRVTPLRLDAAQVIVTHENGTPIYAAAQYGPDGAIAAATPDHADFNQILHNLGVDTTVVVDKIQLPKPPTGARLIMGPSTKG
jgi:hypothetical protein